MANADLEAPGAARGSDMHYHALFDAIDDGFAVIELIADADGRTVDVLHVDANPAYERHTGIHGIVGKRASDVGLERGPWYDAYTEVARTGTAVRIEAHIAAIDRWFSAHVSRIGGDGSRTLAVVFHDITDRKRAEAALRDSEERFRLVADNISQLAWTCDSLGNVNWYNRRWLDYTGLSFEDMRSWGWERVQHPDHAARVVAGVERAAATGETWEDTFPLRRYDGEYRWFYSRARPIRDAYGKIIQWFGTNTDVTDRLAVEVALRESEERQAFLLELSDELRPLTDPIAIQRVAARSLGEHLGASRVFYVVVDRDGDTGVIEQDYTNGVPARTGRYSLSAFSTAALEDWRAGRTASSDDVETDPRYSETERAAYASVSTRAGFGVPLIKGGRLAALLGVNQSTPRQWTERDFGLARDVAERTWDAVERARAEAALRDSESLRRVALAGGRMGAWRWDLDAALIWGDAQFWSLWGYPPSDDPRPLSDFNDRMSPQSIADVAAVVANAIEAGEQFDGPLEIVTGPTAGHWLRWQGRAETDDTSLLYGVSFDITDQKLAESAMRDSEERQSFLLELSDALRPLRDAIAIQQVAVRLLGEHLGVNRAGYYEVGPDQNTFYLTAGWERGLPPLPDRMLITDFGDEIREGYLAGRTMAASDTEQEAASGDNLAAVRAIAVRAWIGVPLVKDGRWVAAAGVHSAVPREWKPAELRLVEDVAERIWAAAERARVEAELRDSEERQRLTLQLVPVLLWSTDPAGGEITLNQRWTNFTGQTDAETQDFGWLDTIHPEDLPATQAAFAHAFATGEPIEREHRIHLEGDGYRWHLVRHIPVRDDRGDIVRWFGAAIDIHDMKLARQALREREEQLALAVDIGAIGHWAYDIATGDFETSAICRRNFGRPEDQPFSYDELVASIHPDDRARQEEAVAAAIASRTPIKIEYRLFTPNGELRWIDIAGRFVDGAAPRLIGVSQDITARKLTAIALQESEERLHVLVAELQHRVRNILTVVRSVFGRTVEAGGSPEDIADHFRGRLDALARTQVITTRTVNGTADLENLIRDELLSVGVSDGPRVTIEGPDVELPAKTAESLGLAMHELITNALKYGAIKVPGASLSITWSLNIGYRGARRLHLTWREQGVPALAVTPTRHGFGSELITEALPYRLGADTKLEFLGGGIRCTIDVPLSESDGTADGA